MQTSSIFTLCSRLADAFSVPMILFQKFLQTTIHHSQNLIEDENQFLQNFTDKFLKFQNLSLYQFPSYSTTPGAMIYLITKSIAHGHTFFASGKYWMRYKIKNNKVGLFPTKTPKICLRKWIDNFAFLLVNDWTFQDRQCWFYKFPLKTYEKRPFRFFPSWSLFFPYFHFPLLIFYRPI